MPVTARGRGRGRLLSCLDVLQTPGGIETIPWPLSSSCNDGLHPFFTQPCTAQQGCTPDWHFILKPDVERKITYNSKNKHPCLRSHTSGCPFSRPGTGVMTNGLAEDSHGEHIPESLSWWHALNHSIHPSHPLQGRGGACKGGGEKTTALFLWGYC